MSIKMSYTERINNEKKNTLKEKNIYLFNHDESWKLRITPVKLLVFSFI